MAWSGEGEAPPFGGERGTPDAASPFGAGADDVLAPEGRADADAPAFDGPADEAPTDGGGRLAPDRPRAPPRLDEETLTARVRGNPDDLEAVEALATLLEASDRDAELFALLSARIDEGDEKTRHALAPRQRAVLGRPARRARRRAPGRSRALRAIAGRARRPSRRP
jgi:hypothetical protein